MFRRKFFKKLIIYTGGFIASVGSISLILENRKELPFSLPKDARFLNAEEWSTIEAVTSRIIPTDDTPGAKEAYVVKYIYQVLISAYSHLQIPYKRGIAEVNRFSKKIFGRKFISLQEEKQNYILRKMEKGEISNWDISYISSKDFFDILRKHTLEGFFSDPKYGGNKDKIGWKFLGIRGDV